MNAFYVACILFPLALGAVWAFQANGEKVIQCKNIAQITDPVMITSITVDGKSVDCGLFVKPDSVQPVTPFQAANDWLQNMEITLINRTNMIIVAGTVALMVLDTATDCRIQVCPMEQINLGQIPAIDAYNGKTGQPLKPEHPERLPLDWKPDQRLVVRIADYMDEIETKFSSYEPVTAVTKVAVHIGPFFFEDGMRWGGGGGFAVPDPEHRGRFKYLPDDYFPGRRGHNWPPGYDQ